MPSFTQSRILPYPAQAIYDLVMDIEKYPEFLPWCKQVRIIEKISETNLQADLLVNFKNFFEKYRSDVKHGQVAENNYFIDVVAIEGPFKKLINQWRIHELESQKCQVDFFVDFEFNSFFLTKMIGSIFERATVKMMAAFEERAKTVSLVI